MLKACRIYNSFNGLYPINGIQPVFCICKMIKLKSVRITRCKNSELSDKTNYYNLYLVFCIQLREYMI